MPDTVPLILAFDTSAAHCAAALLSGDQILAHQAEEMTKGQAERLMGLCQDVLAQAGCDFAALDAIGVGIGPGNFTGIRIAVSAARGLALGLGIPAVGVSGFDALHFGQTAPCTCTIDARRGHVFAQHFTPAPQPPQLVADDSDFGGPRIGAGGQAPMFPPAIAIAHLTRTRFQKTTDRPAPLYLRPADAAPARDAPPVILS